MNRLYAQVVQRAYSQEAADNPIMLLMAYGRTETNDLLLHRPEVCYPAFGFEIVKDDNLSLNIGVAQPLPVKALLAHSPERDEAILYWTRLGEKFPLSGSQQRLDRLEAAVDGVVTDGLLFRLSVSSSDLAAAARRMADLANDLVLSVGPTKRAALIGSARARALATTLHA